jgi:hypothetical protein
MERYARRVKCMSEPHPRVDLGDPETMSMYKRVNSYMDNLNIQKRSDLDLFPKVKGVGQGLQPLLHAARNSQEIWEEVFPNKPWDIKEEQDDTGD